MRFALRLALAAALQLPALSLASEPAASPEPAQVLAALKEGNARFVKGAPLHPHETTARRTELAGGQHPGAAILGCADSRVPPEVVFDEGLGDLFVVRLAGNVAGPLDVGSLEYAVEHLGVSLVVVLGHHACGAVKATVDSGGEAEGNIGAIVKEIAPAVEEARAHPGKEGIVNDAVHANARRTATALLARSPVLAEAVEKGHLKIVVGVYDLASGVVDFE
jgi:carbonic anhydrase